MGLIDIFYTLLKTGYVIILYQEGDIMCTKSELSIILNHLYKAYHEVYGENIVRILLYGSYARGDYNKDSDIDIAAIVHGERYDLQQKLDQVWDISSDLELEYETIVSPTVIPFNEYMEYKEIIPYYKNIQKEGILIGNWQ